MAERSYYDDDGAERCDECDEEIYECGCACEECGDQIHECACEDGE